MVSADVHRMSGRPRATGSRARRTPVRGTAMIYRSESPAPGPRGVGERALDRPMAGRTVLVTGGTGGIGKATALGLAMMGAHVAITGRDRGRADDAAQEIRAAGGQVNLFVADLSSQ